MASFHEEESDSEGGFEDWESDEETEQYPVQSLFSNQILSSVKDLIEHEKQKYGFDLRSVVEKVGYGDMSLIMLVNYIRHTVRERLSSKDGEIDADFIKNLESNASSCAFLNDERYMRPVLQDDALLFNLREALIGASDHDFGDEDDDDSKEVTGKAKFMDALGSAIASNESASSSSPSTAIPQDVITKYKDVMDALANANDSDSASTDDSSYFKSYAHISIHETMLRDTPRTSSYADSILGNASYFKGKCVLDIGTGTGILCMLAARAGARKVVGIDCSAIIHKAKMIVKKNGLDDVITLVEGLAEDAKLPLEEGEVDIIVSEWMGYGLYYENMLASVLIARDKYLSSSGILMPSHASLYLEAMHASGNSDRVGYWKNVYGFDMTDLSESLTEEAQVQLVEPEDILSDRAQIHKLDIRTAKVSDLDFSVPFEMTIYKDGILNSFVLSFDVEFNNRQFSKEIVLSTASQDEPTHWKQVVLWLEPENCSSITAGTKVEGKVIYERCKENARHYWIHLHWKVSTPQPDNSSFISHEGKAQKFILA